MKVEIWKDSLEVGNAINNWQFKGLLWSGFIVEAGKFPGKSILNLLIVSQ